MTLKNRIESALRNHGSASESSPSRVEVLLEQGTLRFELTAVEPLACSFRAMEFETDALLTASTEQLQSLGNELAARLSYLTEPIRLIEIDPDESVIQLRSNPPQRAQGSLYYELMVKRNGIELCRYQKQTGLPRSVIPATVTREVLSHLASDLADAVKSG